MTFLANYKTYIVVAVAAITAGLQAYGVVVPEWVYTLEAACGLGAVRLAIQKVQDGQ